MEEATGKTPQALLDVPQCYGYERDVILAFNRLTHKRSIGMVANPIPLSEYKAYIDVFGAPQIPLDVFFKLLEIMDAEYLSKINDRPASNR